MTILLQEVQVGDRGVTGMAGSPPEAWANARRHRSFAFQAELLLGPRHAALA